MKRERSDLLVGGLLVGTVVVVLAVLLWLSPALRRETYPLYTHYAEIDGLARDATVMLRGFEVGRIGSIEPEVTPNGLLRFRVRLDVRRTLRNGEQLPITAGTIAMLLPPAVIGGASIELQLPDSGGTVLPPGATIEGRSEVPIVEQAGRIGRMMAIDVGTTLESMRALMDSLAGTAAAATRLATETSRSIPGVLTQLEAQLVETQALTSEVRGQLNRLTPTMAATADSLARLIGGSTALVHDVHGLVSSTQPSLAAILGNLESTSFVLNELTREVARSPFRILTGVNLPRLDSLQKAARVRKEGQ